MMQTTYHSLSDSILSNLRAARAEGLTTGKDENIIEEYSLCLKQKINTATNTVNSKESVVEM